MPRCLATSKIFIAVQVSGLLFIDLNSNKLNLLNWNETITSLPKTQSVSSVSIIDQIYSDNNNNNNRAVRSPIQVSVYLYRVLFHLSVSFSMANLLSHYHPHKLKLLTTQPQLTIAIDHLLYFSDCTNIKRSHVHLPRANNRPTFPGSSRGLSYIELHRNYCTQQYTNFTHRDLF